MGLFTSVLTLMRSIHNSSTALVPKFPMVLSLKMSRESQLQHWKLTSWSRLTSSNSTKTWVTLRTRSQPCRRFSSLIKLQRASQKIPQTAHGAGTPIRTTTRKTIEDGFLPDSEYQARHCIILFKKQVQVPPIIQDRLSKPGCSYFRSVSIDINRSVL